MKTFIDITLVKYKRPFKFKYGKKVYWALGYCDDYEKFKYCDIDGKIYKVDCIKENLVKLILE